MLNEKNNAAWFTFFNRFALLRSKKVSVVSIIPEPVSITRGTGYFKLPALISVNIPNLPELKSTSMSILGKLAATGRKVSISKSTNTASIRFILNKTADKELGDEGYHLSVKSTGITITSNKPVGLFYGMQTLWQLLPQEIVSAVPIKSILWQVPMVEITDYPRFAWRGLMFDVSRHFFTKKKSKIL